MNDNSGRIFGWKVIGAYFLRDRSTVIRWAQQRGLPVRRLPGGNRASVYALTAELDQWAESQLGIYDAPSPKPQTHDPEVVAAMVQARTYWASRDAEGMQRAISLLVAVTQNGPAYAPAYNFLADCYVIAGDYGALSYAEAYPLAREAAEAALAINPQEASAHRALGSYHYFWERDTAKAGQAFRRAIDAAPHDALSYIWFGNALADNGELDAAQRRHAEGRMLDFGPLPLIINQAWVAFLRGGKCEHAAVLLDLVSRFPRNALLHDYIAQVHLSLGNIPAYLDSLAACEEAKGTFDLNSFSATLRRSFATGGATTFVADAITLAETEEGHRPFPNRAMAACYASAGEDLPRLLAILQRAHDGGERWTAGWAILAITRRWHDQKAVQAFLKTCSAPPMEPNF